MPNPYASTTFGWETNAFQKNEHVVISVRLLIFSTLLAVSLILQHFVINIWKWKYLPEAGVTMLLGMSIGIRKICFIVIY